MIEISKELKAIRALKIVLKDTVMSRERAYLEECIKELEELSSRSCDSCKHYRPQDYDLKEDILDQWIYCDEIYAETRDMVSFKKFYCSQFEAKGE